MFLQATLWMMRKPYSERMRAMRLPKWAASMLAAAYQAGSGNSKR